MILMQFSHSGEILRAYGGAYRATCHVRNELNGERKLHVKKEVVYAMTGDRGDKIPYMPRRFPLGRFEVFKPQERSSRFLKPLYIPTKAKQLVTVWELDENGGYDHATTERVMDHGYGVHCSEDPNTWGCIRMNSPTDIYSLCNKLFMTFRQEEPVFIDVVE